MKNIQSVRYSGNTVFSQTAWDRYDFLGLLSLSPHLEGQDNKFRREHSYSFTQDAFYALLGLPLKPPSGDSGIFQLWSDLERKEEFEKFIKLFHKSPLGRIQSVYRLAETAFTLTQPTGEKTVQPKDPDPWEDEPLAEEEKEEEKEEEEGEEEQDEGEDQDQDENSDPDQSQDGDDESGDGEDEQEEQEGDHGKDDNSEGDQDEGQKPQDQEPQDGQSGNPPQNGPSHQNGSETEKEPGQKGKEPAQQDSKTPGQETPVSIGPVNLKYDPDGQRARVMEGKLGIAAEKGEEEEEVKSGLMPYVGPGTFPEQLIEVDKLFSENSFTGHIDKFSKMLGFVKRAIQGAHRDAELTSGSLTGYKRVEWSEKLHPVDMMGVANRNPQTLIRQMEGNLRARKYESKRPLGRGPVYILRDESGSMKEAGVEFSKHIQAKMLEVAMAVSFNEDKRELVSIAWDHEQHRICVYGQDNVREHLRKFFNGGTEVTHALKAALEHSEEYVEGADILILTDGQLPHMGQGHYDEILREFRAKNGRVWIVLFGEGFSAINHSDQRVNWADGVIHVDKLADEEAMKELLTRMNRDVIRHGDKVRL